MKGSIAHDLGARGIKASLFSKKGISLADAFIQYDTLFGTEHFVEQRPTGWWNRVCTTTKQLLASSNSTANGIAGAALPGHSLVAVPISGGGELLTEQVPVWCDVCATQEARELFTRLNYNQWYCATDNGDPAEYYTTIKLMWMKNHQPDLYIDTYKILGSKDFIDYILTGVLCTDPSYASGFGVFHLSHQDYEPAFMEAAGIRPDIFPEIRPSDSIIGTVTAKAARLTGLAEGTPVACEAMDNTCMALGARRVDEGVAYTSLGSSSWVVITSSKPIIDTATRPFVFTHTRKGYYASVVSIFSADNSLRQARDSLYRNLNDNTNTYDVMNRMVEGVPAGSHGVLFNPTSAGGSAQEPSPDLKGGFMGPSLGTTREDSVRTSMEGIVMVLHCILDTLLLQTAISREMLICGGGSKSAVWRQVFADIYNLPILKTNVDQDTASLGAVALVASACGLWNGYGQTPPIHKVEFISMPDPERDTFYEKLLVIYR